MTDDIITELKLQVRVVAEARQVATSLKVLRDSLLDKWNMEHQGLLDSLTQAGADVETSESRLRELTLEVYAKTGNKAPTAGVGIREITEYNYDEEPALEWAKEHKLALVPERLDEKAFKKILGTMETEEVPALVEGTEKTTIVKDIPFVSVMLVPQATIATKLEKALGELE